MHEHSHKELPAKGPTGLLVGNPNVGKSVVFNRLTGRYAVVSNYPGTTVEITQAEIDLPAWGRITLIDTPGINGLLPHSEDEKVTQRIILDRRPSFLIQVADYKNLNRSLQLAFQFLDIDCPLILALNMSDEAAQKGIRIDAEALAKRLGIGVAVTAAPTGEGMGALRKAAGQATPGVVARIYPPLIEEAIAKLGLLFDKHAWAGRLLAVLLLGGDPFIIDWLREHYDGETIAKTQTIVSDTSAKHGKALGLVMAEAREKAAARLADEVTVRPPEHPGTIAERIGVWTRRPLTGIPIFMLCLYLMYLVVGRFAAGTLVDFMEDRVFGGFINPWTARLMAAVPWPLLRDMIVGKFGLVSMGLTYAVAIVLPIVGTFFLCFGFLEDSGYLPRLSIMSNRLFRRIGLNGKAVLPMVLGLGCDTMATLTARILESAKERLIVTLLLALGIPCSAQLGVMLGIMASLSPAAVLTVIGVIVSQIVLVGYLAAKVLPGEKSDFILEIPPIRMPRPSNLAMKTYLRVEWFLREAIPIFLLGTFILFIVDRIGLLDKLQILAGPVVVNWLSLPPAAATVFIMGFFRRDYGAAGLFHMAQQGLVSANQMVVSLVVITLFVPCIANFLVILKEQGMKRGLAIAGFIFPFAILVGGLLNLALRLFGVYF